MSMQQETLSVLEQAAARLLLEAEKAPAETKSDMLRIASELQALCVTPFLQDLNQ